MVHHNLSHDVETMAKKERLPKWLVRRGRVLHYRRRVPERYARFDPRPFVSASCETADIAAAVVARDRLNAIFEALWKSLARGDDPNAKERHQAAIERCRLEGFTYMPAARLREMDDEDLVARLVRLGVLQEEDDQRRKPGSDEQAVTPALLGLAREPQIALSQLLETYEDLTRDERRMMSDAQRHKWRLPHVRAQRSLVEVVGDKALADFGRGDALAFRAWWFERIETEELSPESANKDISHLGKMIATISDRHDMDLPRRFRGLRFAVEGGRRPPFSAQHIKDVILKPGALAGLNDDARAIVLVLVELGARPSEIAGLRPEDVRLDDAVPHLSIVSYPGRVLKTKHSARAMPLVGVAIEGARMIRDGANGYRDRGGSLSATVGKYLYENKLLENDDQSPYSFRHAFKDRLTAAGAPDLVDSTLMGHKFDRPSYGHGPTLELKLEWMQKTQVS